MDPAAAADAWRLWRARVDLDAIDPGSVQMLPLVYRNLRTTGAFGADAGWLRGVYRYGWVRNQRGFHRAGGIITELSRAGIGVMGLKGVVVGVRYYGDVGARAMADVDLLVRATQAERAVEVLGNAGWRLRHFPFARERRRGASTPLVNANGDELDLHWSVLATEPLAPSDDEFWAGSVPIEIGGAPARALQPPDQLLHVIVHGLQWNPINSLRWIADAVMVLRATPCFDWARLMDAAARYRLSHPVSRALDYLARHFHDVAPDHVRERLRRTPGTAADRLEWWCRMRGPAMPPGPLGYAWRQYRRLRRSVNGRPRPAGFAQFVADSLRLDHVRQLPGAVAGEAVRRLM